MIKTNIFNVTRLLFIMTAIIVGFRKGSEHKEKIGENVSVFIHPNFVDSVGDFMDYKVAAVKKIRQNNYKIAILKEKLGKTKSEATIENLKPLEELEKINKDLSFRIQQYEDATPEKWLEFKHHFNRDIKKIRKSISEMALNSNSANY